MIEIIGGTARYVLEQRPLCAVVAQDPFMLAAVSRVALVRFAATETSAMEMMDQWPL